VQLIRLLALLFLTIPLASESLADEGTNATIVAFHYKGNLIYKNFVPATFIHYKGEHYYCIHPIVERLGTELEAVVARNCESGPDYQTVDSTVDWDARVCKNPYIAIYHTTPEFQDAHKDGRIPAELIFDLPETETVEEGYEPVSIFRACPAADGSTKLSIVEQVPYLDRLLKPDPLKTFHLRHLVVDQERIADSLGSAVFRQDGPKRNLVGIYTFSFDQNLETANPSYVNVDDLRMLIDKHVQ
jgi:hypothetical protein